MEIGVLLNSFFIWNIILFESIELNGLFIVGIPLGPGNVLDHMVVHLCFEYG
jgi:hypothetical protein